MKIFKLKRDKALTLIELMVVIAILGLLASVILISINGAKEKASVAAIMQYSSTVHKKLLGDSGGMLGEWLFENSANDSANKTKNCTVYGDPIFSSAINAKDAFGFAATFNGSNYIDCPNISLPDHITNQRLTKLTITGWFYAETLAPNYPSASILFEDYNIAGSGPMFGCLYKKSYEGHNQIHCCFGSGNCLGISAVAIKKWHFIVSTYDASKIGTSEAEKFYFDGKFVSSGNTIYSSILEASNFYIGGCSGCARENFVGQIDNVRVYGVAFSSAQIEKMYAEELKNYSNIAGK